MAGVALFQTAAPRGDAHALVAAARSARVRRTRVWPGPVERWGIVEPQPHRRQPMAKPNYQFEKRQRELAKKRKKEEKVQRKAAPQPGAVPPEEPSEVQKA